MCRVLAKSIDDSLLYDIRKYRSQKSWTYYLIQYKIIINVYSVYHQLKKGVGFNEREVWDKWGVWSLDKDEMREWVAIVLT